MPRRIVYVSGVLTLQTTSVIGSGGKRETMHRVRTCGRRPDLEKVQNDKDLLCIDDTLTSLGAPWGQTKEVYNGYSHEYMMVLRTSPPLIYPTRVIATDPAFIILKRADSYYKNYDDLLQYVSSDCVQLTIHDPAAIPLADIRSRLPLFIYKVGFSWPSPKQLLVLCAIAIENKNRMATQQMVCALRNKASFEGDPTERVTAYFLQALVHRAGTLLTPNLPFTNNVEYARFHDSNSKDRLLSLDELTKFVGMTPHYCFGFMAANGALLEAFEGRKEVHIIDFSTAHCMQWPTFIQALADRTEGPPHVRLTVSSTAAQLSTPPKLKATYECLGSRLIHFASSRGVPLKFHVLSQPLEDLEASDLDLRDGECLGINCALRLHYLADESSAGFPGARGAVAFASQGIGSVCPRDKFLALVHNLNPAVVTLYEEDCDTTSLDVGVRLRNLYDHEWLPFDFLATVMQGGNDYEIHRLEYETNVGRRIKDVVCSDIVSMDDNGSRSMSSSSPAFTERLESRAQWVQRMRRLHFRAVPIGDEVVAELQDLVDHHASGWGLKINLDDHTQWLSWKGHTLTFASTWRPVSSAPRR